MITIDQMVQREVLCCMSSLVSTLATGTTMPRNVRIPANDKFPLASLVEQASELAAPVLDYEEAARQAGWYLHPEYHTWVAESADRDPRPDREEYGNAKDLCETCEIDPTNGKSTNTGQSPNGSLRSSSPRASASIPTSPASTSGRAPPRARRSAWTAACCGFTLT